MIKAFLTLMLVFSSALTFADDHAANEPAAVETWLCTFNEGKGMADMHKWFDGINEYAKTQTNNQYNMHLWVPNFVSDLKRADIALTVTFPSLAGMAASQIEFFGSKVGSALFEEYQEILDCSSREVWMVTQKRMGM